MYVTRALWPNTSAVDSSSQKGSQLGAKAYAWRCLPTRKDRAAWTDKKRHTVYCDVEKVNCGTICNRWSHFCFNRNPHHTHVEALPVYSHRYKGKGWRGSNTAIQGQLDLLTTQQPISWVTGSWDKENDFIQKARKPRRSQTSILENHLEKLQNSGFLYARGREGYGGVWS